MVAATNEDGHRLLEILFTALAQRVQYFYSLLAIGDPALVDDNDWYVPIS